VDDAPEITVLQLPKFKAEATELIGADGIEALAVYLIGHPDAGDVIPGSGGVRKLRWAAKGKGKRGGARIIYLYVVVAARIYLIRCYAKNVKTDLTPDEKKQLRQIAALLKGAQYYDEDDRLEKDDLWRRPYRRNESDTGASAGEG
jgi:hypothetical protein